MLAQRSSLHGRRLAIGILLGVIGAIYQVLLASEPHNDQFMNVAWGREILAGHLPVRDFFEAGEPLSELVSAGAEALVGYRLLAEALVVAVAIGTSTWLVFWLTRRLTNAAAPPVIAALLVVLAGTRSYSYPKVLIYAAAAALIWQYVTRRSWFWLAGLSCWTGVAFLWRHDYGLYLALSTAFAIAVAHGFTRRAAVHLLQAGGFALLVTGPYFAWVQIHRGIPTYMSDGIGVIGSEFSTNPSSGLPDWPLRRLSDVVRLEPQSTHAPLVQIRWSADSTPIEREATMRKFQLVETAGPEPGDVFARVLDPSPHNVRGLVNDATVLDTNGIDRRTSSVRWTSWGPIERLRFRYVWLRVRPFPAFDDVEQAGQVTAWLFIVLAAAAVVWAGWPRAIQQPLALEQRKVIAVIAALFLISTPGLLREPYRAYAPDVVALPAVLSGCAAWVLWRAARARQRIGRFLLRMTAIGLTGLVVFAVSTVGQFGPRVDWLTGGWKAPAKAVAAWTGAWERLTVTPPVAFWYGKPATAPIQLARYVRACTTPDAPLLVLAFTPELQFYADRRLASRHFLLGRGRWTSVPDQKASLEKLRRSSPPIIIAKESFYTEEFPEAYPLMAHYVQTEYAIKGEIADERNRLYFVLTRLALTPVAVEPVHGWPCFTTGGRQ